MRPKILDFAIDSIESTGIVPYQYDFSLALNVVMLEGIKTPFISSIKENLSTATKTRVRNEQDDYSSFLVMATKTKVQRESDDNTFSSFGLTTKTFVRNEQDD